MHGSCGSTAAFFQDFLRGIRGAWDVPSALIEEAISPLQSAATRSALAAKVEVPDIERYTIQYQGVMSDSGKNVAIRGSCRVMDEYIEQLSNAWYLFSDGTPCYFGAFYDPKSGSVYAFAYFGIVQ